MNQMEGATAPSVFEGSFFDHHMLSLMYHELAEQHFHPYGILKNWLDKWNSSKDEDCFWRGVHGSKR